jgi:hypothetical protein
MVELQTLADRLRITVCHFPPGTSKWNKIEHRLFSFISQNWRGQPLLSHAVIVSLIAATTITTVLRVRARLDTTRYPSGLKVSHDAPEASAGGRFHGNWNNPSHAVGKAIGSGPRFAQRSLTKRRGLLPLVAHSA